MDYKPLVALALLLPATAWAQDAQYPSRRAGLWEGTTKMGGNTLQSKSCIDPATDRKMMDYGNQKLKEMGGQLSVKVDGNVIHLSSVATIADHTMTMHQTITFHGDSEVIGEGHTTIDPPFPQMAATFPTDSTSEQHWVGPCPADMKPGDIITNGQKRNVNDIMNK
jgi:hypothetical protein